MWAHGSHNMSLPQQRPSKEKVSEGSLEVSNAVSTLKVFLANTSGEAPSGACTYPVKSSACTKPPRALPSRGETAGTATEHRSLPRLFYEDNRLSNEVFLESGTTRDNFSGSERPEVGCGVPGNGPLSSHRASSALNLLSFSDSHSDDQLSPRDRMPLGNDKYEVWDINKNCFAVDRLSTDENKQEGDSITGHKRGNANATIYSQFPSRFSVSHEALKHAPPPFFAVENKSTSVVFLCNHVDSEDPQELADSTNSIGGHHFSIAHGGVFLKESCSWREENFYEMLTGYQMELVKKRVRRQSLKSHPKRAWNEGLWKQYCDYERSCLKVVLGMDSSLAVNLGKEEHQGPSVNTKELGLMRKAAMQWWHVCDFDNDEEFCALKRCEFYDNDKQLAQKKSGGSMPHKGALSSSCCGNAECHVDADVEHEEDQSTERHRSLLLLARFAPRFYGVRNLIKQQVTSTFCPRHGLDSFLSTKRHPLQNSTTREENLMCGDTTLVQTGNIRDELATGAQHIPELSLSERDREESIRTTCSASKTKASSLGVDFCRRDCSSNVDLPHGPHTALLATTDLCSSEYKNLSTSTRLEMGPASQRNSEEWVIHTSVSNSTECGDTEKDEKKGKVCRMIVLEDACYGFKYPCVLDVKIGRRQYGLNASSTKKESKERKSRLSTSGRYYIRLAGIKMWDAVRHIYVTKTKLYCRSLSFSQVKAELSQFLLFSQDLGLVFRRHIEELRETMKRQKAFRFYTSSLLLIYDAAQITETARIIMVDFAYTYERWELVEGGDPDAVYIFDEGYIKALDTLISLIP